MAKENLKLNILGMTCVNCSKGIERVVNKLDGVKSSKVSFSTSEGSFDFDNTFIREEEIYQAIKNLGYRVEDNYESMEKEQIKSFNELKKIVIISMSLTIFMFILAFSNIFERDINNYLMLFLGTIVQFFCGLRFYKLSYKSLKNRNYDMNVLVSIGTSAAYFYSSFVVFFPTLFPEDLRFLYFDGAAVIISFVLLGRYLEENSKQKASSFLKNLMKLTPQYANLQEDKKIKKILVSDLKINDHVLVKTGEKIPCDGLIIEGSADIDASMITGESIPVFKEEKDEVLSGTLNTNGLLIIKVLKEPNETTLSKIIFLLKTAQSKQIPISRFADKIANIFVPSVIVISLLTFFIWVLLGNMQNAILASISVLIISCPCALGLATPIAIVSSVSRGAKEGILIKNPEILEQIKEIKYAVFDKTGTLTKGKIRVVETDINEKYFDLIASVEKYSEHPISEAVVKFLEKRAKTFNKNIENIEIIPGRGIKANFENKEILIGNINLLKENDIKLKNYHKEFYEKKLENANGVILVAIDKESIGSFALEDELKDGAKELILSLKNLGIKPVLLTGDNKKTALNVAKSLQIDEVYSEVIPTEKYELIEKLQRQAKVMFVGDGINDAPSIKKADIGITLNSGADISKDAGDIILVNNELKSITKSISLSIETMKIVKQNLFWAFIYNTLGIPLAAGILYVFGFMLSPMYAGIAMSMSSVTVVLNSLRLKLKKL